jgi:hypothetical protein
VGTTTTTTAGIAIAAATGIANGVSTEITTIGITIGGNVRIDALRAAIGAQRRSRATLERARLRQKGNRRRP